MISEVPVPSQVISVLSLEKPSGTNDNGPRLSSARKAQEIVWLLLEADKERAYALSMVKGMLDGNTPFNQSKLIAQGQGNRTNVNFREGEAILSSAETPYYDLFAESSTYFQIEVDESDPNKQASYSRILTRRFDDMLKEWSGFDYNMQRCIHEMVGFGRGFCLWPDSTNWQFTAIQQSRVLVPDGTLADPDQLEITVIRQSIPICDLYSKVRNPEAAKKIGWDVKAVMEAIQGAMPETRNDSTTSDYERIQEEIRNHDLYESIRSDVIRVANIFVREFNGKVSHLIVEERNAVESRAIGGKSPEETASAKFLYKKIGKYNCFRECFASFFFDIGDGTWHSVKGLGVKLFPFIEIKNRLNCSIVDNAFINMSVLLQATSGRSEQDTALMQLGSLTVLPANFEVRQWNTQGKMEEGLFVERSLTSKLENNTGQYRRANVREGGNPDTATKVNYDALKEASLNKGAVNRFYTQLDNLGDEIFRRATNLNLVSEDNGRGPNAMAIKFQQKCLDDGLPKSYFKKIRYVRASRNSGNGSVFLRQQVFTQTSQFVPMMNEEGRQAWLDDAIAVLAGTENVQRWNPKKSMNPSIQNDQAHAMIENDVLKDGSPVMITSTQNPMVHATTHLLAATEAINSIPKGGDPVAVLAFLDAVGPHVAQHLQAMAGDVMRGPEVKVVGDQLKQLGKIADKLRQQIMQQQQKQQKEMQKRQEMMAEQQRRTQAVMTDEQLKQIETEHKLALSRKKADATLEMKRERQNQDMMLKRQKAAQDAALSDASTATDIRSKTAKTAADIALKSAKPAPNKKEKG